MKTKFKEEEKWVEKYNLSPSVKPKRPNYINPPEKIKKVSEVDLKEALKEINRKNKEFRESFRIGHEVLNFTCY